MNARAELLLHVLCVCVRVLTRDQAMRLLRIPDRANVKRLVRGLVARGLVSEITVWAKPVPEMREPLFASEDSYILAEKTVAEVLRLAHARWAGVSALPTACIVATRRAGQVYGVDRSGSLFKPLQVTHDLAVSEVLLALLHNGSIQVEDWHGEDTVLDIRLGNKYLDAGITGQGRANGELRKVVEVVGADYTQDKLRTIGHECNRRNIPFDFW